MPHSFISRSAIAGSHFTITGSEAHHLGRVLRVEVGDNLDLFDGEGKIYKARVERVNATPPEISGIILTAIDAPAKNVRINLFQGLPKGPKFDYVIEKAVELGVDGIYPFLSEKNVIKLEAQPAPAKLNRWGKVAHAAAKQCARPDIPRVEWPRALTAWEAALKEGITFLGVPSPAAALKDQISQLGNRVKTVNIVVGPESGFSQVEITWLKSIGAHPVQWAPHTLRTETAGLAALSILTHFLETK